MARVSVLRAVTSNKLADRAYDILRDAILRREFPPGYRLDFDELQARLEISRTPLQEALSQLAAEGLVTTIPYRGTYVTELVGRDLAERFAIRELIEVGISDQIVANLTDADLRHLQALHERMGTMIRSGGDAADYMAFLELDMQFQRAIVAVSGNQQLIQIYDGLNLKLQMAMVFYLESDKRFAQIQREHGDTLAALQARDVAAFCRAARAHIRSSKDAVVERVLAKAESREAVKESVDG